MQDGLTRNASLPSIQNKIFPQRYLLVFSGFASKGRHNVMQELCSMLTFIIISEFEQTTSISNLKIT